MLRLLFSLLIIQAPFSSSAQLIVNIESSRIQSDTTGWKGDVGTSFSFTKNVQQILNINASAHVQYKTQKDLYLLLANYSLLKGNNQQLTNNMFYHLRYNRKLNDVIRWEVFTHWQQNRVTNIDLRALFGTGPRFKVSGQNKFRLYIGVLAMYEHEKDKDPPVTFNDIRSDNYISATYKPNAVFDITTTTFYQPLFRKFSDYRILNQVSFNVKATKHLAISTNWDFSYDSFPAIGAPLVNYVVSNGFYYTF